MDLFLSRHWNDFIIGWVSWSISLFHSALRSWSLRWSYHWMSVMKYFLVSFSPEILKSEMKVFFVKYNDPIYVKLEKLDIMIRLTSQANIAQVSQFIWMQQVKWEACLDEKTFWCRKQTGGRLNKKDGLTRYGDSHVKDKTSWRPSYL